MDPSHYERDYLAKESEVWLSLQSVGGLNSRWRQEEWGKQSDVKRCEGKQRLWRKVVMKP